MLWVFQIVTVLKAVENTLQNIHVEVHLDKFLNELQLPYS